MPRQGWRVRGQDRGRGRMLGEDPWAKSELRDFISCQPDGRPSVGVGAGQTRVLEVREELKHWGMEKRQGP